MTYEDVSGVALVPLWISNATTVAFSVEYFLLGQGLLIVESYVLHSEDAPRVELRVSAQAMRAGASEASPEASASRCDGYNFS